LQSTSCEFLAQGLLESCIAGNPPLRLPRALLEESCTRALFGILVEGLADRFEPALCDVYARLFSQAIASVIPASDPAELVARYRRVRTPRPVLQEPERVLILSRVTLGADVAVTSVVLAAAKLRFPQAEIVFAGPRKNFELFAADPRLTHAPVDYRRGSLGERLAVWEDLKPLAAGPACLVLDPDSRLTQLGLLPIGEESRYHLFETRGYGGHGAAALPELAARWCHETLGVAGAVPYVAPGNPPAAIAAPYIAVSLGVGENPAKRIADPFETELLALLYARAPIVIDKGAGGEEAARVELAVSRSGARATFWEGSFAGFAHIIAGSRLYVGYDSAGQHVAAATGVPLITVFAGFPAPRMFQRWRPVGPLASVIRADPPDPVEILDQTAHILARYW
jgi:hypothetical protein